MKMVHKYLFRPVLDQRSWLWDYSQIFCDNIVNLEQVPIYDQFGPKGPN